MSFVCFVNHEDILGFEVAMGDSEGVEVVDCCGKLVSNFASLVLLNNELAFVQELEEITAVEHLHHDVDGVLVLEDVEELDDVGVLAHLQHFNFSLE